MSLGNGNNISERTHVLRTTSCFLPQTFLTNVQAFNLFNCFMWCASSRLALATLCFQKNKHVAANVACVNLKRREWDGTIELWMKCKTSRMQEEKWVFVMWACVCVKWSNFTITYTPLSQSHRWFIEMWSFKRTWMLSILLIAGNLMCMGNKNLKRLIYFLMSFLFLTFL